MKVWFNWEREGGSIGAAIHERSTTSEPEGMNWRVDQ